MESIEDKQQELCKETRVHLEARNIFNEIEMVAAIFRCFLQPKFRFLGPAEAAEKVAS